MRSSNLASEFHVASQLWRQGKEVTITLGNTKEIDLIVTDGKKVVTIDVKGLKNKTNWPLKLSRVKSDHFFALVCWQNNFEKLECSPEVFIIPSTRIKRLLGPWSGSRTKQTALAYSRIRNSKYKDAWHLLFK